MSASNGLREVRLPIEGMECAACAIRLEKQLQRSHAVDSASVNFATSSATVAINSSAIDIAGLREIVERTGFSVRQNIEAESDSRPDAYGSIKSRLLLSALLTLPVMVISMVPQLSSIPGKNWILLALSTPVVAIGGRGFFKDAGRLLKLGTANMNTLIAIGVGVSYLFSLVATVWPELVSRGGETAHVYYEAAAVITTLILLGRLLEARARAHTTDAIEDLMDLQPEIATVVRDGKELDIPVAELLVGDTIVLKPGSRVPADGVVLMGESDVDESMLTGEPLPASKIQGSAVSAGTINLTGSARVEVQRVGSETTLQGIIRLVRDAQGKKPPIQRLADRVASIFVPAILVVAAGTFVVWMLVGPTPPLQFAIIAAVSVLIIACPCALGLATPTAVLVGIGGAAKRGVFIKGGDALERLANVDTVVMDKTGTLTEGRPRVANIILAGGRSERDLLAVAASIEAASEHPIGKAITAEALSRNIDLLPVDGFRAHVGGGVEARVDGRNVAVGSRGFAAPRLADSGSAHRLTNETDANLSVLVVIDGNLIGGMEITDTVRSTSRDSVASLQKLGVKVVMATGDLQTNADAVASEVGISDVHAGMRPDEKADLVQELRAKGATVAVVGDGINDAPALAIADVGLAVGTGTDIAMETADVGLLRDDMSTVVHAMTVSRKTMTTIRQNLFFAFVYNVIGIPIAAGILYPVAGILLNPMVASLAMALSSVSVVSNSLRLRAAAGS